MYLWQREAWPSFTWRADALADLLAGVRHRQGRLQGQMEALGFPSKQEAVLRTLTADVVKSSEIEGERLDMDQVRSSIARRLGIDIGALAPADRNVEGVVEMMLDATGHYDRPLTRDRLFDWHAALFPTGRSGITRIRVGAWRDDRVGPMEVVSGPMGKERVHFQAPPAERLEAEMARFLAWCETVAPAPASADWKGGVPPSPPVRGRGLQPARGFSPSQPASANVAPHRADPQNPPTTDPRPPLDNVLKAGLAHLWFVTVHPFDDGNGRIARAVADLLLARSENSSQRYYSMSAQIRLRRAAYYDILEETQRGPLDVTLWLRWFLETLDAAIAGAYETLAGVLRQARYWDALAQYPLNDRQRLVLRRLLAGFEGKLTTSKYAKLAKCSHDTALRDIAALVEHGALVRGPEGGRSTGYTLAEVSPEPPGAAHRSAAPGSWDYPD